MVLRVIPISKGLAQLVGCSSGFGRGWPRAELPYRLRRHRQDPVDAAYAAAMAAGAQELHGPGLQFHYDPRYYAAQVRDPDGYSLEFV